MNKKSRKSRKSRKSFKKPKGMTCKEFLSNKIAHNIREFKRGKILSNGRKIKSIKQAIAISYSQVKKSGCKLPRRKYK